jgi:hypothetical protein
VTLAIQLEDCDARKLIFFLTLFFLISIPFVNCSWLIADSTSNRKGRTNNNGNQESSKKGRGKEARQEGRTEEEVINGNRQHIRGTR